MKRSIKIASIVLAVIVVLTVGIVLYNSGAFVSTEQLQTEGFKQQPIPDSGIYEASFFSNKVDVADVGIEVGLVMPQQDLASIQVYITQHEADISKLNAPGWMFDSFYLEFTPANPGSFINWYLETPAARPWPRMVFQTGSDFPLTTIVGVDNLGFVGTGMVNLAFYLEPYGATSFWFNVNFTMHATGSLLTRQVGSAQIELPITFANTT